MPTNSAIIHTTQSSIELKILLTVLNFYLGKVTNFQVNSLNSFCATEGGGGQFDPSPLAGIALTL